ncbi:hypothetical protein M407DRAFT_146902 [Tulasnella calospora MUT 4182]|uniref:Uncharacterized protein n=1 Tax=Tulasnella calospora MUT 4182 TaxID=1051891 RepID=A0A0C3LDI8_9AGAM|nr:hypothetical protein M407DRAFT_146902 [Tulasnella calospora MUT 4182]
MPDNGGYIQVLRINLAADEPEFFLLAELKTDKLCSGMSVQDGTVVATFYMPGAERMDAFIWKWEDGERIDVSNPEPGGTCWFIVITEIRYAMWNGNSRSIDVHWSPKSDRPGSVDRYPSGLSEAFPDPPRGLQVISVMNECRNTCGDAYQVFLLYSEQETIRVEIETLGTGRISLTKYSKDNTYIQDPSDPNNPVGNEIEIPRDFSRTVGGHLVEVSSSGCLTVFLTPDSEENTKLGESMSYSAFTDFGNRASETHLPFICPFSGVIGTLSKSGDFYIWRMS